MSDSIPNTSYHVHANCDEAILTLWQSWLEIWAKWNKKKAKLIPVLYISPSYQFFRHNMENNNHINPQHQALEEETQHW